MKCSFTSSFRPFLMRTVGTVLLAVLPLVMQAQSYEQLWKDVENLQQKDLPRSAIQKITDIYEKAQQDQNAPQLMKAYLSRMSEQVKLTPDSAEVEVERLKAWAASEQDVVTAALLNHLVGTMVMLQNRSNWKSALISYRSALKEKKVLLNTPAADYAPITESTSFSRSYFKDNLYDLLVRQTISFLMSDRSLKGNREVYEWIVDLYDSLIECYGIEGMNNPTAALLTHEAKILFLTDGSMVNGVALSKEEAEKALKDLLRLYEEKVDADAVVDVNLELAQVLCDQQKLVEAMGVLRATLKKYPKTTLKEALEGKMEWIQAPSLTFGMSLTYPLYRGELEVNYKNITELELETYRLCLGPDSPELNRNRSYEDLCRSYGKKISTKHFSLPATADYRSHVEKLVYQLPKAGIYMVKATPVGREGKSDYRLMYVSPYQCLAVPLLNNQVEVVVVDRLSGNPIPYAEVVEYQKTGDNYQFVASKVWKTNKIGSVVLNDFQHGSKYLNARTSGNNYMKISSVYPNRNYRGASDKDWRPLTTLFTDRVLYRPGQIVHVSGIRYQQLGDSLRTLVGQLMEVELVDMNGKQVGKASATSDVFGVFSVDFTLPQQLLPGYMTLRTDNKSISIRVENYKRPTFDVKFAPTDKTYGFDDVLKVEGTAQTFAGAPVRLAKGTYQVKRSQAWMWRNVGSESVLSSGTFSTDENGNFKLDVSLDSPFNKKELEVVPYYNFVVRTTVTNGAGETQEGMLTIPVGTRSLGIQVVGLKSEMACEHRGKIQFQTMNLSKRLVKTEVTYQVFAMNEADEASSEKAVGNLVLEDKVMSQQLFVPEKLYSLPSGEYRLKISARDDQGRLVSHSQNFVLFSLADKRMPVKAVEWFYKDGDNWENGKKISLYLGSSERNVYVLMDVFTADKRIRSERFYLNNTIRRFDFSYKKEYGDGIVVSFAFLREGKLYTKSVNLERPRPKKQLTLKWESFRNQLVPGQQEVWRMKISDRFGNLVPANLLATLYDASLDKLMEHNWRFYTFFSRWLPYMRVRPLDRSGVMKFYIDFPYIRNVSGFDVLNKENYSRLSSFSWGYPYDSHVLARNSIPMFAMKSMGGSKPDVVLDGELQAETDASVEMEPNFEEEQEVVKEVSTSDLVRRNFAETAFFYPALHTDVNGEVSLSFTLPDALTEWKFMGFAHTQTMDYGQLTSEVKASKPFMVQPNLPRFVRVGDASSLAVSLMNLSMETVEGKVRMELVDPLTNQVVFKQIRDFKVLEGETGVADFSYKVLDQYDVLVCRVVAEAGEFSDGEQHYLPVLSDKEWITETIPFQVEGDESLTLSLKDLFNGQSTTVSEPKLTVEMTANPNWYVIQALPVVGNPVQEDVISWAVAYYANAISMQLVRDNPRIQRVFESWMADGTTKETLWSKLETNADLKNVLLAETPWLAEVQTETEQKRRVALLFELNGMDQRMGLAVQQLKKLQTSEGGWSWYPGMPVNRYTSTRVVELLARLKAMGIMTDATMNEVYLRGLEYLRHEAREEYERILKVESLMGPSEQVVRYLYICAISREAQRMSDKNINSFFINRMLDKWDKYSVYGKNLSIGQKAMMAVVMFANNRKDVAEMLVRSLKEYLVTAPDMGTYFDTSKAGYSWNGYRIPTHVAAMEAIRRISPDGKLLDGMKLWLLKQKQVQVWNTPVATADAIYAFLMESTDNEMKSSVTQSPLLYQSGRNMLDTSGMIKAVIGRRRIFTPNDGLGYARKTVSGVESKVKTVYVQNKGQGIGWGAVYAQYFEQMNRIDKSQHKGLAIEREYWVNEQKLAEDAVLRVGDKVKVRLFVKVDRDMDFVVVKDHLAACMEPAEQLSGYGWNEGLASYRVNRDASVEFFMDKMRKGKYILTYNVYVNRTGVYQAGTALIQSVYAPEFTAHTQGSSLVIE